MLLTPLGKGALQNPAVQPPRQVSLSIVLCGWACVTSRNEGKHVGGGGGTHACSFPCSAQGTHASFHFCVCKCALPSQGLIRQELWLISQNVPIYLLQLHCK